MFLELRGSTPGKEMTFPGNSADRSNWLRWLLGLLVGVWTTTTALTGRPILIIFAKITGVPVPVVQIRDPKDAQPRSPQY